MDDFFLQDALEVVLVMVSISIHMARAIIFVLLTFRAPKRVITHFSDKVLGLDSTDSA